MSKDKNTATIESLLQERKLLLDACVDYRKQLDDMLMEAEIHRRTIHQLKFMLQQPNERPN